MASLPATFRVGVMPFSVLTKLRLKLAIGAIWEYLTINDGGQYNQAVISPHCVDPQDPINELAERCIVS